MRILWILWACMACVACMTLPKTAQAQPTEIMRKTEDVHIAVYYPAFAHTVIDTDIAHWAADLAQDFEQGFSEPGLRVPEAPPFELTVHNTVTHPSERALSVIFEVATYTGGVHGNLDILVRSYDRQSGRLLTLEHLFEDVENALMLMSTYCAVALRLALGTEVVEDMLKAGTSPDADNFAAIALTPEGMRIYFQPYQVAPWSAGPQKVDMSLESLADARPLSEWWGKKVEANSGASNGAP